MTWPAYAKFRRKYEWRSTDRAQPRCNQQRDQRSWRGGVENRKRFQLHSLVAAVRKRYPNSNEKKENEILFVVCKIRCIRVYIYTSKARASLGVVDCCRLLFHIASLCVVTNRRKELHYKQQQLRLRLSVVL